MCFFRSRKRADPLVRLRPPLSTHVRPLFPAFVARFCGTRFRGPVDRPSDKSHDSLAVGGFMCLSSIDTVETLAKGTKHRSAQPGSAQYAWYRAKSSSHSKLPEPEANGQNNMACSTWLPPNRLRHDIYATLFNRKKRTLFIFFTFAPPLPAIVVTRKLPAQYWRSG